MAIISNAQIFNDETSEIGIDSFMVEIQYGSGSNLVDVDNNGYVDLFVVAGAGSPNNLYFNNGSSWSQPISIGNPSLNSRAAVWFDYNGDKLLDVFLASDCETTANCLDYEAFALYKNNGNGTFSDVSVESFITLGDEVFSAIGNANYTGGVTAGDINLDGYLDLLVTRWGGELFLFENKGDGTFAKKTSILSQIGLHFYWQPLIYNLDDDVWPEIFVTLDADEENIFLDRNSQQGIYEDKARENNLHHKFHDMGVAVGDYDNDSDYDLYISNIDRFDHSRNVLYRKLENSGFQEVANSANVDKAGWAWGVTFADFNNDGILDLGVTNGWEAHNQYRHDQSKLWLGNSDYKFTDASNDTHFNDTLNASSLSSADIDRDGDIDLVQGLKSYERSLNLRVLKNDLTDDCNSCNYLVVKPRMMGQNHWAIGSSVSIKTNEGQQMRAITAGSGFYSQEPSEAFFGLGEATSVAEMAIRWPSGDSTILYDVEMNQILTVYDSTVLHTVGFIDIDLVDSSSLKLEWGHMSTSENQFIVQRSESSDFSDLSEITLPSDVKELVDSNLALNTEYYYRIKALNSVAGSQWSETIIGSTRLEAPAPFNLLGDIVEFSINLTWSDSSGIGAGYELQRSLDASFESSISYIIDNGIKAHIDKNVEPGFSYFYRIKQNSQIHTCPFSETVMVSVPEVPIILDAHHNSGDFLVYPNPSKGTVHFDELNSDLILLYNLNGQLINSYQVSADTGTRSINIAEKGIFVLRFYNDQKLIQSVKITIQ